MQQVLLITCRPDSQAAWQALDCANMLANDGKLAGVFFYGDGAFVANGFVWQSADHPNLANEWATFAKKHNISLPVCVSAALARGITDEANAKRHQLSGHNLHPAFVLVGLGDLAMMIDDNCLIQF